jgi:tRNA A37 threonylcarbamoyladenosine dehydratase
LGLIGRGGECYAFLFVMLNQFSRTELLLGAEGLARLKAARVAVFGLGGVGSYAAEALVRSGVGAVELVDDDRVCLTNLNRQLCATRSTVGQLKVEAMRARLLDINPDAEVAAHAVFFMPQTADRFDFARYSYVVDAVDTVTAKLALAERCRAAGVPVISCMGAGNKLDPTRFEVADIFATSVCPLAKVMRKELRARGIPALKVVYSKEPPVEPEEDLRNSCKTHCVCPPGTVRKCTVRHQVPGSVAFVPPVAGLILAGEVVKDLVAHD